MLISLAICRNFHVAVPPVVGHQRADVLEIVVDRLGSERWHRLVAEHQIDIESVPGEGGDLAVGGGVGGGTGPRIYGRLTGEGIVEPDDEWPGRAVRVRGPQSLQSGQAFGRIFGDRRIAEVGGTHRSHWSARIDPELHAGGSGAGGGSGGRARSDDEIAGSSQDRST